MINKIKKPGFFLFLFLGIFISKIALPCDPCKIFIAREAEGQMGSGYNVGIAEQFTHMGTLQNNGNAIPNLANQYLDSSITQFYLGYNHSDFFGVPFIGGQLNIPLIYRTYRRPEEASIEQGSITGLGDISLMGNFVPINFLKDKILFQWAVHTGIKFPTGDSNPLAEELSHHDEDGPLSGIHGHDLALGSGSFDGIFGSSFYFSYKKFFINSDIFYVLRTEGDFLYEFADEIYWSFIPGYYLLLTSSYSLSLEMLVTGTDKGFDTLASVEDVHDTSITQVFLGPRSTLSIKNLFSITLGAEFPVINENSEIQIVPDYRFLANITFHK